MAGVPKIELYSPQESLPQCYAPVSPCTIRAPIDRPISILSPDREQTIKTSKSDNGMRKNFWSKLRRNKSETLRPSDILTACSKEDSRQARSGGRLVWSNERHIWMFPDHDTRSVQHSPQTQWWLNDRRPSSTIGTTRTSNASDELLFAQLPGHYTLSPYDSANNNNILPTYTPGRNFDDVATRTGTESQWTLVAKRVSGSNSVR
ncbi:conserved hypothetical protein [Histoplasma capsulatum G186AR]|uniref:Uncharacterized protein n=2 Tax=Ajellomyces capsulatus TaxID=5037 RepID=C0NU91_AJECG|nr:uncharacterized protein HCBG_06922 [Histoplasma capsulatum G186AR]EEH04971.1 conserved hypothetical protein [Histoplasma capsulatum G186AR]KAG5287627.1 hypothetical protein I7I52_11460 [Histoplasma capsulatum]QSS70559.1 hypothetical protein I7I50_12228 [Histoplasma capsulatum G186AR]